MKILKKITAMFRLNVKKFRALSLLKKALVVILVVLVGWFGVSNLTKRSTAPAYQTATVTKDTLITSVTSSGTVSSGNNSAITTQATGVVSEVNVKNGDYVNQGDTIATLILDQTSLQKQDAAYASYLSAQNSLNSAKNQMNSLQAALFEANQTFVKDRGTINPITDDPQYIIERANWLKAETDYTNQKNVIAQTEASLSSAWLSYSQTSATITSPISGTISNLGITSGVPIVGSTSNGAPSTQTLGNISLENVKQTATVNLTEIDITKVKVGQKVTMTLDAFPDKTYTGKVSAINTNGSVSSGVTTYPTTITFDSAPENMYPNMAVNATIILHIKNDVLLVPTSAVQTVNGASFVRVLQNGKEQQVPVEIGDASDTQTEIVSGLKEGETIIIGTTATQTTGSTTQSASPFGGGGFGGNRTFGGGGGAQRAVFIQR